MEGRLEATMTAYEKASNSYEIYNVASKGWITVNEVADIVIKIMGLNNVEKTYKPIAHGIGWLGDVKRVALRLDKLRSIGFKPKHTIKKQ